MDVEEDVVVVAAEVAEEEETTGVEEFIPTTLGTALVVGYENMGFETSLTKPFLRKEVSLGVFPLWQHRTDFHPDGVEDEGHL